MPTSNIAPSPAAQRAALLDLLVGGSLGVFLIFSVYLGDRLGYYRALANGGPMTSRDLSRVCATDERYTREWLEQQCVAGVLTLDAAHRDASRRVYALPPAHADVLVHRDHADHLAPLAQLVVGTALPIHSVVEAHRTGKGVPFSVYGADVREGQAGMNRAMFLHLVGRAWLPAMKDVHQRLGRPPARVADVGCGAGWSSIAIAEAYPGVMVDGIDLDAPSIDLATANAIERGVADRVHFHARDAADPALQGRYDLVTAFECIHDLSDPVAVLRAMRGLAAADGSVLVVDERVGDAFDPGAGDVEKMMYGWSVFQCLPAGRADEPSAATGTVMRRGTLERYAKEAGFCRVEVLPVDNAFFRLYRLML